MLWTILVTLLVLWLLSPLGGIGSSLIQALLVSAAVMLIFDQFRGRRKVH